MSQHIKLSSRDMSKHSFPVSQQPRLESQSKEQPSAEVSEVDDANVRKPEWNGNMEGFAMVHGNHVTQQVVVDFINPVRILCSGVIAREASPTEHVAKETQENKHKLMILKAPLFPLADVRVTII